MNIALLVIILIINLFSVRLFMVEEEVIMLMCLVVVISVIFVLILNEVVMFLELRRIEDLYKLVCIEGKLCLIECSFLQGLVMSCLKDWLIKSLCESFIERSINWSYTIEVLLRSEIYRLTVLRARMHKLCQ